MGPNNNKEKDLSEKDIFNLVSDFINIEEKGVHIFKRLQLFSKKLKKDLDKDSKIIDNNLLIVDGLLNKKNGFSVKSLKIVLPSKEEHFSKKLKIFIEKSDNSVKNYIVKDEEIKKAIEKFKQFNKEPSQGNINLLSRISGYDPLHLREVKLEQNCLRIINLINDLVFGKFKCVSDQLDLLKHKDKDFVKLKNLLESEKSINDKLMSLIKAILGEEKELAKIESEKKSLNKHISPPHTKRNIIVLLIVLVLVSPFVFKSFSPSAGEQLAMSKLPSDAYSKSNVRIFSSSDIVSSQKIKIVIPAKTSFINSLMQLYYFAGKECSVKSCVLDESAINALLSSDKSLKSAALSASEISLKNNVLTIKSSKPLSTPVPGSKGTASISLQNTVWQVSESSGKFEFVRVSGSAWLTVNPIGRFGGFLSGKNIKKMESIDSALLFQYKRDDGSVGLFGSVYDSKNDVKNGIDLTNEDFGTVNVFPDEEGIAQLAFDE